jgi:site-specific DNA-methyltransferase (adenine-specific)
MEYLIKLVTPKGGVVLDPFMGSGSTGKAAIKNDFNFIGIEREKEYFDIAKTRIEHAKGSGLFKPEINQDEL